MAKEIFLSMTRNERMEAARVLCTTDTKEKTRLRWWETYNGLLERLKDADFKWDEISLSTVEQTWRDNTRKRRVDGTLTHEQHQALKIIGFPFNAHLQRGGAKGRKGINEEFERAVNLYKRSKDPGAEPLTQEESETLRRAVNTARSKYQDGALSERSARMLGIVP